MSGPTEERRPNMEEQKKHPVVLRFAGMYPHHLGGYEAHRTRKGGDLGHVDRARSGMNRRLVGREDWVETAAADIREMALSNFADELEALEKRKRKKDLKRRMVEGPKAPWRPTRHGPLREVILTAKAEFFDLAQNETRDKEGMTPREKAFEELAVAWLTEKFGGDVVHARADRDEQAYHIHAVIVPRTIVEIKGATRHMLQPSKHELIEDYEAAQESVGTWFAEIDLVRGERRAQAIRDAREQGETPPPKRWHARTSAWRAQEELRLEAKENELAAETARVEAREKQAQDREADADAILAVAEAVEAGHLEVQTDEGTAPLRPVAAKGDGATRSLRDRIARGRAGAARAAGAFRAAAIRIAIRAQEKAQATARTEIDAETRAAHAAAEARIEEATLAAQAEARAGVEAAYAEIRAADDAIVEVAKLLPNDLRTRVANARSALVRRIAKLGGFASTSEPSLRAPEHRDRPGSDEIAGE
jgi:hypothetical protein